MEIVFQIFVELILQLVGEVFFEVALRRLSRYGCAPQTFATGVALVLYFGLGIITGFITLLIFPRSFVRSSRLHGISLIITPVLAGLVMTGVGWLRRRQGQAIIHLDTFVYAFVFAFGMALMRFLLAT